jgi:formate dehydrogenase subunit gamma
MPAGAHRPPESWSEDRVLAIVAAHKDERGPLLPILHDVIATFGYVDSRCVPVIAEALNLSRAEVHGVITFYRDFRTTPGGSVELRICRAEACQSVGADALLADAQERFGVKTGETTPDGRLTLDEVFCLGDCALGPAVMIGHDVHGRMDGERLAGLVAQAVADATAAATADAKATAS